MTELRALLDNYPLRTTDLDEAREAVARGVLSPQAQPGAR